MILNRQTLLIGFALCGLLTVEGAAQSVPALAWGAPQCQPNPLDSKVLAAGDLDGDTTQEIFAVNALSNMIEIYDLDATGWTFVSSQSVASGPRQIITADLEGDGDLDILVSCYFFDPVGTTNPNMISVLRNNGGVLSRSDLTAGELETYGDLSLFDVDADGDLDLVFGGKAIRMNLGLTGFASGVTLPLGVPTLNFEKYRADDLDLDGDLDHIRWWPLGSPTGGLQNIDVFMTSPGGLALATSLTVDHIITDLEVGDFDGDGDRDFAIAWSVPSFIAMSEDVFIQPFFQEPGMLFSPGLVRHATSFNFVPSPLPVVLSVGIDLFRASVDGDAIDDLQLVVREPHMSTDTLFSWLGSASGVLLNAGIAPLDTTNATVAFADLDQDGKDELLQSDSTQFCARSVLGSPLPTPTQTIVDLSFVRPKAFIGRGWTISPIFELRDLATGTPLPGQTLSVAFTQPGGTTTTTTFTTDALGRIVVQPAPGPTAGRGTLLVAGALAATLVRETSTYVFDVVHNANPPVGSPFVSVRFRVETGQAALMTLVSDLPTPPTSTPFGTLYTSILAPAPSLAAIDGLGLFGPWNPAGIAAPEFFQLFTVPAGIPPGFTLVVQNYALDLSQPWPHSLVISPERTLVF